MAVKARRNEARRLATLAIKEYGSTPVLEVSRLPSEREATSVPDASPVNPPEPEGILAGGDSDDEVLGEHGAPALPTVDKKKTKKTKKTKMGLCCRAKAAKDDDETDRKPFVEQEKSPDPKTPPKQPQSKTLCGWGGSRKLSPSLGFDEWKHWVTTIQVLDIPGMLPEGEPPVGCSGTLQPNIGIGETVACG